VRFGTAGFSFVFVSLLKLGAHMKQYFATGVVRRAAPKLLAQLAGPILAIIILIPSLQIGPVGDDYRVIETAQPLSFRSLIGDLHFGSQGGPHYRPLEPISLRIDHRIWGESPWGYHVTNILLHASSSWLTSQVAFAVSGSWLVAGTAGALFALHPIAASTMGQISARNSALVCLLLLMSTWLYLKLRANHKLVVLLLSLGAFGMALLSKEQAYLFPGILLLLTVSNSESINDISKHRSRKVIFLISIALFVIALLLVLSRTEIVINTVWGYRHYDVKFRLTEYGLMLAGFSFFLMTIGFAMRYRPGAIVLIWYLVVEALVVFLGLLPSGQLSPTQAYLSSSSSLTSLERLSADLFVLLSTLGALDFGLRDALILWAPKHPWIIGASWVTAGALLLAPLLIARNRIKVFAGLAWFLFAMSPLFIRPVEFFETNNLYLAVPIVAISLALIIKIIADRSTYLAIITMTAFMVFWGGYLLSAEAKLITMGNFARELHSVLKGESKSLPGPLRVIVNIPDPFRSTTEDRSLAHWMVFRIAQSAIQLGGYSDENVSFVEGKVVQVLGAEPDTTCRYEAKVINSESIAVGTLSTQTDQNSCLSQLRLIDFVPQPNNDQNSIVAYRKPQYRGRPLTQAKLYVFDGNTLHELAGAKGSSKPNRM
jgi:hypothetical protein